MFQKLLDGKKRPVDPFGMDLDLDSDMARVAHPTKSKLVETATRLLKTHKPSEISVDLVLSESKISKGSLYHHFADLDELIGLSDSIKVLLRGKFVADADPATVTPQELGTAMTGAGEVA